MHPITKKTLAKALATMIPVKEILKNVSDRNSTQVGLDVMLGGRHQNSSLVVLNFFVGSKNGIFELFVTKKIDIFVGMQIALVTQLSSPSCYMCCSRIRI